VPDRPTKDGPPTTEWPGRGTEPRQCLDPVLSGVYRVCRAGMHSGPAAVGAPRTRLQAHEPASARAQLAAAGGCGLVWRVRRVLPFVEGCQGCPQCRSSAASSAASLTSRSPAGRGVGARTTAQVVGEDSAEAQSTGACRISAPPSVVHSVHPPCRAYTSAQIYGSRRARRGSNIASHQLLENLVWGSIS